MCKYVALVFMAVLAVAADVPKPAPLSPAEKEKLLAEVQDLDKQMLDAWKARDDKKVKGLMADDYMEIDPQGRFTKEEVFEKFFPHLRVKDYSVKDIKPLFLGRNRVLLTYQYAESGTYKDKGYAYEAHASSLWVRRDGKWQILFWQATKREKE